MENNFGEYLKLLRNERNLTLIALSELSGISIAQLSRIENGKRGMPKLETLNKLSSAFGINYDDLLEQASYLMLLGKPEITDSATGASREMTHIEHKEYLKTISGFVAEKNPVQYLKPEIQPKNIISDVELIQIPIYGEIRAGYDSLAAENIVGYEKVSKDTVKDGVYFYLIVKGDSMIDEGIREGMRVLVKSQNTCEHGKIGIILVNGDEGTLKRVFYDKNNVILQASNKDIPPRVLPIHEVRIQGQVKKVEFDV
ncbi:MAG: S24 family peptidase [Paenibacillaceae bacterium]